VIFTIIVFIAILAVLVLIHEFGHFIAAKKNGVRVDEFGFGFPPRLFGIKKGETLYSVNLIPLGGFVKLYGEEYHESESDSAKVKTEYKNRAFVYKKHWQKALIIVAGIIGNFLLGWVLISFLFTQGVPTPTNKVIVERIQPNSPAQKGDLQENDVVQKFIINEKTYVIHSSDELIKLSRQYGDQNVTLEVLRNNRVEQHRVTPRKNPPAGQGPLGVVITSFIEKKYTWYLAPIYGLLEAFKITKVIVVELTKTAGRLLIFQRPSIEVAGPIGIAQYTGQAIKFGKNAVLELIALLSLNLAVINILPFPALDGGRLMFVVYEWISGRRVNKIVERYTNLAGIIILLSLAVAISINDIIKLYK